MGGDRPTCRREAPSGRGFCSSSGAKRAVGRALPPRPIVRVLAVAGRRSGLDGRWNRWTGLPASTTLEAKLGRSHEGDRSLLVSSSFALLDRLAAKARARAGEVARGGAR